MGASPPVPRRFGNPLCSVGSLTEVKTRRSTPGVGMSGLVTTSRTVNSFWYGLGELEENVGPPVSVELPLLPHAASARLSAAIGAR